ncbi:DUF6481 family protein [Labrys wisconsinensis]|uniref:Flagellar biosynthesis/type III secretory pathway protein FliH n=1 Tax=Labrys wisconsinensis TaxID=425677 RepID=A0ABU0J443_9HYPH|nr:DUF6481 family protein [Labrys wisconsinensis]MDQ0469041.1 flagellar biosynthesis/type III secretory pathway protein FliH [Labrys wisconsinensis]
MSIYKDRSFVERRSTAEDAKKAQLDKFRAKLTQEDPAAAERRAARQAVVAAREARQAERDAARRIREAEEAAERAAREEAERIEAAAREAARQAEEAAREKARPKQIFRDFVAYAERRATANRR